MIYESYVWKGELKKELTTFRKLVAKLDLSNEPGIPDKINLKVEKFFFVSAFIIRKLNEARKLSDELNQMNIRIVQFARINKEQKINIRNNHLLDKFYDLEIGSNASMGLAALCNMLIHSFVFKVTVTNTEAPDEKETILGILVNSDYSKDKAVYYIELEEFYKILEETINDDVVFTSYNYETGKFVNSRKPLTDDLERIIDNLLFNNLLGKSYKEVCREIISNHRPLATASFSIKRLGS